MKRANWISFKTIVIKEFLRIKRIWIQTLLPPLITSTLYFLIFGNLIGKRIGNIGVHSYMQFIAPGLILMAVITNAYSNVSGSFYAERFIKSVEELLVSPTSNTVILSGYVMGGILRSLLAATGVALIALSFTHLSLHHFGIMVISVILTAILFSLAGFTNALFSQSFDDISIIPTFILGPLTYLGGVFYSINMLPNFWRHVAVLNPILYMVSAFRYGVLGTTDVNIYFALGIMLICVIAFFGLNLTLLNKGTGIRN